MSAEKLIEILIELSNKKKELMSEILSITKRQREFIELGKIDTVVKQIDLKEKYINEIDKLDIEFFNAFNELKAILDINSIEKIDATKYPQVKELKSVVGDILNITNEVKIIEDENILRLQRDKGELSNKLRGVRQGKKVSNAYGSQKNMVKSMFFDRKK